MSPMTPRTIAFISLTPGSGKTTACANLAVMLAQMKHRVLVVDLDPQAQTTQLLGIAPEAKRSTGAVLAGRQTLAGIIQHTQVPYLSLAAAAPEASDPINSPARAFDRLYFQRLAGHAPPFAFILVDTPTSDDLVQQLALTLCDEAILPFKPTLTALYAAVPTMEMYVHVRNLRESELPDFLGFLPMAVSSEREMGNVRAKLRQYNLPYFSPIRRCQRLRQPLPANRLQRRLIALTGPNYAATADFRQVAREIVMGAEAARQVAQWCAMTPYPMAPRPRRPRPKPYF
ncbi:MAG: ParA family protein [Anaerolineales bacterium]|nr:ParA family protein [Anaerolineales bacterium]